MTGARIIFLPKRTWWIRFPEQMFMWWPRHLKLNAQWCTTLTVSDLEDHNSCVTPWQWPLIHSKQHSLLQNTPVQLFVSITEGFHLDFPIFKLWTYSRCTKTGVCSRSTKWVTLLLPELVQKRKHCIEWGDKYSELLLSGTNRGTGCLLSISTIIEWRGIHGSTI